MASRSTIENDTAHTDNYNRDILKMTRKHHTQTFIHGPTGCLVWLGLAWLVWFGLVWFGLVGLVWSKLEPV